MIASYEPIGRNHCGETNANRAGEPSRRHADDSEVGAVDADDAAEKRGIEVAPLPDRVRRDCDRRAGAGALLGGGEGSAGGERHAERFEVVRRDDGRKRLAGEVAVADADRREAVRHQAVEDAAPIAQVDVGGIREVGELGLLDPIAIEDGEERVDASLAGPQDQRVDQREDGGVGADAQREHEHGNGRECRLLAKQTHAVPEVLQHTKQ